MNICCPPTKNSLRLRMASAGFERIYTPDIWWLIDSIWEFLFALTPKATQNTKLVQSIRLNCINGKFLMSPITHGNPYIVTKSLLFKSQLLLSSRAWIFQIFSIFFYNSCVLSVWFCYVALEYVRFARLWVMTTRTYFPQLQDLCSFTSLIGRIWAIGQ